MPPASLLVQPRRRRSRRTPSPTTTRRRRRRQRRPPTRTPRRRTTSAMLTLDRVADYEPCASSTTARPRSGRPARSPASSAGAGSAARRLRARPAARPTSRSSRDAAAPTPTRPRSSPTSWSAPPIRPAPRLREPATPARATAGGPLLVPDGSSFGALARHRLLAARRLRRPREPGIYTRVGDERARTSWVHSRTPRGRLRLRATQPRANEPVTLTSTSRHPEGAGLLHDVQVGPRQRRRLRRRRRRARASRTPSRPRARQVAGLEASQARRRQGHRSTSRSTSSRTRARAPPAATRGRCPTATPPAAKPAGPPGHDPRRQAPEGRRRGRFPIRVRFAKTAPRGTAVVEVYRGKRQIGIARTSVSRGGDEARAGQAHADGQALLQRSATKRLKVRVRVRVGRTMLRTKTLTIRR